MNYAFAKRMDFFKLLTYLISPMTILQHLMEAFDGNNLPGIPIHTVLLVEIRAPMVLGTYGPNLIGMQYANDGNSR
jgi:hypothetical protein